MEEERKDFLSRNTGLASQWTKAGGLDAAKVPKSVLLPSGQRILVASQKDTGEVEAGDVMVSEETVKMKINYFRITLTINRRTQSTKSSMATGIINQ